MLIARVFGRPWRTILELPVCISGSGQAAMNVRSHPRSFFGSHPPDLHSLFHGVSKVVIEEPVARLPQTRLAALFKSLQLESGLIVGRFRRHFVCLLLILFSYVCF